MGEKPTEADEAAEGQKSWLPANFRRVTEGAEPGFAIGEEGVQRATGGGTAGEPVGLAVSDEGASGQKKRDEVA